MNPSQSFWDTLQGSIEIAEEIENKIKNSMGVELPELDDLREE